MHNSGVIAGIGHCSRYLPGGTKDATNNLSHASDLQAEISTIFILHYFLPTNEISC